MNKALEIAIVLTAVDKMNEVIDKAVGKANHTLHTMSEVGGKMAMGGTLMTEFFGETIEVAEKNEVAQKRLERVFKNVGDANGEAAKQAEEYSEKLSAQIGVEHANIEAVQAKLTAFRSVSGEVGRMEGIFDRATQASFDLAADGFGEAATNSVVMGKALEDPIKGLTALRRIGIVFTDSEKKKIKTLTETNHKLEAQKLIMSAVEKRVGGVASTTATNTSKMKVAWEGILDTLGKGLLPIFNAFVKKVQQYLPVVKEFIEKHQTLIKIVAAVGVGLLVLGTVLKVVALGVGTVMKVVKALTVVFDILAANPIILVMTAIALVALLIYKYWDKIVQFFKWLWDGVKSVFSAFWEWLKGMVEKMPGIGWIIKNWGKIKEFFSGMWDSVKGVFQAAWDFIKNLFLKIPIVGSIIKNWDKIKTYFSDLWTGVKAKFTSFIEWIEGIPGRMWDAGKNMIKSLWDGIKSMAMKPIEAIKSMVGKIREYLPFSPAKVGPLKDLHRVKIIETIAENMKPHSMVNAMRKTTAMTMVAAGSVGGISAGPSTHNSGGTTVHYSPVIHMTGGGSKEEFAAMLKKHEAQIVKVVDEANRKNQRTKY